MPIYIYIYTLKNHVTLIIGPIENMQSPQFSPFQDRGLFVSSSPIHNPHAKPYTNHMFSPNTDKIQTPLIQSLQFTQNKLK